MLFFPVIRQLVLFAALLCSCYAPAFDVEPGAAGTTFLSESEAFQVSGSRTRSSLTVHFTIAPGYYLYQSRIFLEAQNPDATRLGKVRFLQGHQQSAPRPLEKEIVYKDFAVVRAAMSTTEDNPRVLVHLQGCSAAGLCYPPTVHTLALAAEKGVETEAEAEAETGTEAAVASQESSSFAPTRDESGNSYGRALFSGAGMTYSLGLFFLGGLLLALTPCVLPMLPLVSAMLVGSRASPVQRFLMSCAYVLGMAFAYAAVGVVTGLFGAGLNLPVHLQSPWVQVPLALLFVLLGLSLCGLYELRLPATLGRALSFAGQKAGRPSTLAGAALAGAGSVVLLSPCVSAPLAGALTYLSSTGDALMGGLSLFVLGLGMGVPLLMLGAGGARWLPRAGSWMEKIKVVLGLVLLAMAVWVLERLLPGPVTLGLWGLVCTAGALLLGALDSSPSSSSGSGRGRLRQLPGILLLIYGVSLLTGGLRGHSDPLRPLAEVTRQRVSSETSVVQARSEASLAQALQDAADAGLPALVDVYADWCVQCKVFERRVLAAESVQQRLTSFVLIRLDVTAGTADQNRLLAQYQLFGPPSLLFFDASGRERPSLRSQGGLSRARLLDRLDQLAATPAIGAN